MKIPSIMCQFDSKIVMLSIPNIPSIDAGAFQRGKSFVQNISRDIINCIKQFSLQLEDCNDHSR
jgi:hypothetical protein